MFERVIRWSRKKSPWILHLNSGACNACDIEVVAALTPRFDVERLGRPAEGHPPPRRRHHRHRPGHPPAAGPDHPDLRADARPEVRRRRRRLRHVRLRLPRGLQRLRRPRPGHPGQRLHPGVPGPPRRHPRRRRQAPQHPLREHPMNDEQKIEKLKTLVAGRSRRPSGASPDLRHRRLRPTSSPWSPG